MLVDKSRCESIVQCLLSNDIKDSHRKLRQRIFDVVESGDIVTCQVNGRLMFYKDQDEYTVKHKNNLSSNKQKFDCFDEAYLNFIHRAATDGISFHRG